MASLSRRRSEPERCETPTCDIKFRLGVATPAKASSPKNSITAVRLSTSGSFEANRYQM